MDNKAQKFKNITEEMVSTYVKKNADYGDSFSQSINKFGWVAAATRMSDKLERFCNLTIEGKTPQVNESTRDTLLDLANYAIMTVMEIDRVKEQTKQTTIKFN